MRKNKDMALYDYLKDPFVKAELFKNDPALLKVFIAVDVKVFDGMKKTPYVALIGAVVGQKISFQLARKYRSHLYTVLGSDFTIQTLMSNYDKLKLPVELLQLIHQANLYILTNKVDLKTNVDALLNVKGIGTWTINTAKLSMMEDSIDLFPCRDTFLRDRIKRLYNLPKRPTIKETEEISKKWAPYRSVVCWYMWRWF